MKTVVITGSARGLGFEMAKVFKEKNINVILSDINMEGLIKASTFNFSRMLMGDGTGFLSTIL